MGGPAKMDDGEDQGRSTHYCRGGKGLEVSITCHVTIMKNMILISTLSSFLSLGGYSFASRAQYFCSLRFFFLVTRSTNWHLISTATHRNAPQRTASMAPLFAFAFIAPFLPLSSLSFEQNTNYAHAGKKRHR